MFISAQDEGYGASVGKWYNIIVTYDSMNNTHTAYVNGSLGGTMDDAITNDLTGLIIGSYKGQDDRFWEGFIDEAAIWN